MNRGDKKWWGLFREETKNYLTDAEFRMISEIYARIYQLELIYPCKCSPTTIQHYINQINLKYGIIKENDRANA